MRRVSTALVPALALSFVALASVIAGALWNQIGPQGTFLAGALFAAVALAGLDANRR